MTDKNQDTPKTRKPRNRKPKDETPVVDVAETVADPIAETPVATVASQASEVIVDGLAETQAKVEKIARIRTLQTAKKARGKVAAKRTKRLAKLRDFANGTNESGDNAKLRHNPALLPETLRPSRDGELVNDLPAKGWVVTIRCQHLVTVPVLDDNGDETAETTKEICGTDRLINTQDAFQTRFCVAHKGEAQKAASKVRRDSKKDAELLAKDEADLDAEIAALETELAA